VEVSTGHSYKPQRISIEILAMAGTVREYKLICISNTLDTYWLPAVKAASHNIKGNEVALDEAATFNADVNWTMESTSDTSKPCCTQNDIVVTIGIGIIMHDFRKLTNTY
jgi:hypothetical protein